MFEVIDEAELCSDLVGVTNLFESTAGSQGATMPLSR